MARKESVGPGLGLLMIDRLPVVLMYSGLEFTDRNFKKEVLGSKIPVFVDFWASWCPPCKVTEPIIDRLEKEYEGRVKVGKLNVDRNPVTAGRYEIAGVPVFITIKDGEEVERKVAAQSEKVLRGMVEGLIK